MDTEANRTEPQSPLTFVKKWARPARRNQEELLDDPNVTIEDLEANFRDLRLINRYFNGIGLTASALKPFLPPLTEQRTIRLLDLASGAADVPLGLAKIWAKRGYSVEVTALDLNPKIIELAKEANRNSSGVEKFEAIAADVFTYAYPQEKYDFVTCSLAFHHFGPEMSIKMVELMAKMASRAFVVNDLERSWFGFVGAKLLTYTLTRHRLTRNDAPLSVLRSFSPAEFLQLGQQAKLPSVWTIELRRGIFSRLALVGYQRSLAPQKKKYQK